MSTDDKLNNTVEDVKGKGKEAAGKLTGDDRLEREGKVDQSKSALKDAGEHAKDAIDDAKSSAKDALDR